jgi:hypothetical protein
LPEPEADDIGAIAPPPPEPAPIAPIAPRRSCLPLRISAPAEGKASVSVLERHVAGYIEGEYAKARRLLLASDDVDAAIAGLTAALDDGLQLTAILAPTVRREVARSYHVASGVKAALPRTVSYATTRIVDALHKRAVAMARTTRDEITPGHAGRERLDRRWEGTQSGPIGDDRRHRDGVCGERGHARGLLQQRGHNGQVDRGRQPCPDCAALDGTEYPIEAAPDMPAHPHCGCSLTEVSDNTDIRQ